MVANNISNILDYKKNRYPCMHVASILNKKSLKLFRERERAGLKSFNPHEVEINNSKIFSFFWPLPKMQKKSFDSVEGKISKKSSSSSKTAKFSSLFKNNREIPKVGE